MIKNKKILIIALLAICSFCTFAANKNVIAIFDYYDAFGHKSTVGTNFTQLLFANLSTYDDIKMVEREELNKVIKERKLKRSGLVKDNYLQIAALINADYIVTGRIFKDEGEIIINLKLTRCSDGSISGKSFFTKLSKKKDYLEQVATQAAAFIAKSLKKTSKKTQGKIK